MNTCISILMKTCIGLKNTPKKLKSTHTVIMTSQQKINQIDNQAIILTILFNSYENLYTYQRRPFTKKKIKS